mmetsp:Transcript_68703/g.174522  ORF Transcript_68703/g.174522 Transcript_68703/m.174522 type:complete len:244 (+) Transcript_68703:69-800(+)
MPPCLCCGYETDRITAISGRITSDPPFHCCEWCQEEAALLAPEVADVLVQLEAIPPAFSLWGRGRREDAAEGAVRTAALPQPAEIASGLFVGDLGDVANISRLEELNIKTVVNLCAEKLHGEYAELPARLAEAGIVQAIWLAEDKPHYDIVSKVAQDGACDFIDRRLRAGGVLVNCWGGVNRSASVAVAYLVLWQGVPLVDAVRSAMAVRGTVLTNRSFRLRLALAAHAAGRPSLGKVASDAA